MGSGLAAGRLVRVLVLALMALVLAAQKSTPPEYATGLEAYERGEFKEAYRLLAKAAQKRHPASVYYRALMLWEGKVGRLNDKTAASWFRFAAAKGHVEAQYMLARVFLSGRGFKRDPVRSRQWLAKTVAQGHAGARLQSAVVELPESADSAARLAALGEATGGDAEAVVAKLIAAAGGGDTWAMAALGDTFIAGGGGLEKAPVVGAAWYERAAELGDDAAMRRLAGWHAAGTHVAKSLDRAAEWLRRSAKAGNADSAYRVGKLHEEVKGGAQAHRATALEWYWQAARGNHGKAMRRMGYILENGSADLVNVVDAFYWFSRAEVAGEPTLADRQRMTKKMNPQQMAAAEQKLAKAKAKGLMK